MDKGNLFRSWAEIDLKQLRKNCLAYKNMLQAGQQIMAVVKADGYGHGAVRTALTLQKGGVELFAVSNVNEAVELRDGGIEGEILILGYTPAQCASVLKNYDITQALLSSAHAESFVAQGISVKAQFAIDTGMNRIGLDGDDPNACASAIRHYAPFFRLTGLFTHLCSADTPDGKQFTNGQIKKFIRVAESVKDLALPYVHYMNTAGGLWHNPGLKLSAVSLVRLGISLYGLKPDYENVLPAGIAPALTWKAVISMIKTVKEGETIGYGRTYTAPSTRVIATVPVGYADGYNRALSNKGVVLVHGKRAPIVGRVCMDQIMIDVTDIPEAKFEDEVTLIGTDGEETYSADDMARDIGTIGYEVVCDISKRVPRIYH